MRLSTRLLSNATTTYLRLGTTFALGLFTTWYILGAIGVAGFGLISLAFSTTGLSHALERAIRFGVVRELAASIASGDPARLVRTVTSAARLCRQAVLPLAIFVGVLSGLAWVGLFNTPEDQPELKMALAVLILSEGVHAAVRLLLAPYLQSLFAAQKVGLDNLLLVIGRVSYTASAVLVFGMLDASLTIQLLAFAGTRATLQLADVGIGLWLVKRRFPDLRADPDAFDAEEYRSVRATIWHSSQVSLLLNANYMLLAVLINLFFGLTYNGIWQIVIQIGGYVRMFTEGTLRGIAPLAAHLHESGRSRAVRELMIRSLRYQFTFALPAALFLGLFMIPILELWVGGRLAADPGVSAAGIGVGEAIDLTAAMARVVLVIYTLRAGFLGVEHILYGIGQVGSYAWFAKWALLICNGLAITLMVTFDHPIAAPIAMLVAFGLYSPGVILTAARRVSSLPIAETLGRSMPRPLLTATVFAAALIAMRLQIDRLTLLSIALLLAGAAGFYGLLGLLIVPEPDERARLMQLTAQGLRRIRSGLGLGKDRTPGSAP